MNPPFAAELNLRLCHGCKLSCSLDQSPDRCPRCGVRLRHRKPNTLPRTWALMIAALVLYIPANLLPIMHTSSLDKESSPTILGGVVQLWQGGSWDIAVIIFVASIGVPVTKFLVLTLLLVTVQTRHNLASRRDRTRLFRALELIGYWSMLDVFVAGLLSALVQFGVFGIIEPRIGILFFGIVVVLTMLATLSFDPRLIWDNDHDHE